MRTTLNEIKKYIPCQSGYAKLLKFLGKTKADNEPLGFKTILESNGIADAIWCLRAVTGHDKEIRLYAVWCARQVEHLDPTGIAKQTNDVTERFANGEATYKELTAAWAAAWDSARAAAIAPAWAAAWDSAWAAAWDSARAAAWDSARDSAWAAQEQEFIKRFCTEE
jgi:hypothetical protein